ncbi:hypothetical protein [Mycetocola miduiensis]|uniref:Uncharacterized protein n=1 Tax=Mycetocola miduiensis TaxID=995034 RepID=A0A1I5B7C5_9MICO|nr:hypothetical protein [Mycetocola miduiensis]SFN70471.1 hypothetical protein SAMN05216219_1773 [Mycetocola miduiensis]
MQARRTRVTRGVLAAAVSTFTAAFSHGVASGEAPSIVALAVASVLAVAVCVALAGRATPARLTVAVAASQAAFHGLFGALPDTSGTATQSGHHGMVVLTADVVPHVHQSADVVMWLGHAAAAAVTIAALQHGERVLRAFGNTLGLAFRAVIAALGAVSPSTPATTVPGWLPVLRGSTALLPFSANRRGPPLLVTARSFA